MNTIQIKCQNCGKDFSKPLNEYKRSISKNRKLYCSRSCSGSANLLNFGEKRNIIPPTKRNKANPFKYYLRNCKKRNKECNLDLEYLKQIWDIQNGICPYSKVNLILNTHSYRDPDIRYTASLDRIDSNFGYIKGNVQFTSTAINYMKSTMSSSKLEEFLVEIANNLLKLS